MGGRDACMFVRLVRACHGWSSGGDEQHLKTGDSIYNQSAALRWSSANHFVARPGYSTVTIPGDAVKARGMLN